MIIETEHGKYKLIKNHREAFDLEQFNARFVDVAFARYPYLVGDVASGILRIKGFSSNKKSANGFKFIPDYISESCNFNTPYYILKKYNEKEKENNE